jgi:hypothetical protein
MRKLALVTFLMLNLGGIAMAATPPQQQIQAPRAMPQGAPFRAPNLMPREPRHVENGRTRAVRRAYVVGCDDVELVVQVVPFARVPQLDGSMKDFPIAFDTSHATDLGDINHSLLRGFEQVLNAESARQGRTVDALLAKGAVLGNHDADNHVALYQFNLDAELRIVREAYLLHTQPTRA